MRSGILTVCLLAIGTNLWAADLTCPPGAQSKRLENPSGTEAWCELEADHPLLHGPYRAWHPNGVLGVQENFIKGVANGKAAYRWSSGSRQAEGNYRNGIRDGVWLFWDKTGAKAGQVRYKDGELISGQLPKWALDWDTAPVAKHPPIAP